MTVRHEKQRIFTYGTRIRYFPRTIQAKVKGTLVDDYSWEDYYRDTPLPFTMTIRHEKHGIFPFGTHIPYFPRTIQAKVNGTLVDDYSWEDLYRIHT